MSRYEGPEAVERDPAQPYLAPLQTWESLVRERHGIEQTLHMSYMDLLTRYREKCAECDREKRNAMIWEKEQRLSEKELNGLKAAAVSPHMPPALAVARRWVRVRCILAPTPGVMQGMGPTPTPSM
jgi:hypothetical protein